MYNKIGETKSHSIATPFTWEMFAVDFTVCLVNVWQKPIRGKRENKHFSRKFIRVYGYTSRASYTCVTYFVHAVACHWYDCFCLLVSRLSLSVSRLRLSNSICQRVTVLNHQCECERDCTKTVKNDENSISMAIPIAIVFSNIWYNVADCGAFKN